MRAFLQPLRAASARHQLTLARKPLAAVVVSSRSYSAEEKSAKFYKNMPPGVVIGLAYSSHGGSILYIESSKANNASSSSDT